MAIDKDKYAHLVRWSEDKAVRNAVAAALPWLDGDLIVEESFTPRDLIEYNRAASSAGRIRSDYIEFLIEAWVEIFGHSDLHRNFSYLIDPDLNENLKDVWNEELFTCSRELGDDEYVQSFVYLTEKGFSVSVAKWRGEWVEDFTFRKKLQLQNKWTYDEQEYELRTYELPLRDLLADIDSRIESLRTDISTIVNEMKI